MISQVLTIVDWAIIAAAVTLIIWLIVRPYLRGWSRAERRAADLLRDILTPEQCQQVLWHGYLEVPSPTEPHRVYRVPRGKGFVQVIERGHPVMRLCLQPAEALPDADLVVLHKLMIEGNEENYLKEANKYLCTD